MRYLTTNNVRDLYTSMYLMPLGMLFDFMDGRVARWRNNSSLLGQELDSLADLVNKKKTSILQAFLLKKKNPLDFLRISSSRLGIRR